MTHTDPHRHHHQTHTCQHTIELTNALTCVDAAVNVFVSFGDGVDVGGGGAAFAVTADDNNARPLAAPCAFATAAAATATSARACFLRCREPLRWRGPWYSIPPTSQREQCQRSPMQVSQEVMHCLSDGSDGNQTEVTEVRRRQPSSAHTSVQCSASRVGVFVGLRGPSGFRPIREKLKSNWMRLLAN